MSDIYDLIVIGGGSMGLSTAYHAGKRSKRTLVLERFGYFNDSGSSAGASRQYRIQYSQKYMSELALAAQNYWNELQLRTFEKLIGMVGSVWFGDPSLPSQEGGIGTAEKIMDQLHVPYTKLNAQQIESFGFRDIRSDYSGFYQGDGGIINLKATQEAMYNVAQDSGFVDFHSYEQVTNIISRKGNGIVVQTQAGEYRCRKLAITPGPYVNEILVHLGLSIGIDIWEMSSAYYKKIASDIKMPTWFVFQEPQDKQLFYGFPEVDWAHPGYVRVAPDIPDRIISDPSQRSGCPDPASLELNSDWVRKHMVGLDDTPQFTSTCLITLARNKEELLLDYAPSQVDNSRDIVVYTAGWAAKFIPILGEMIMQMLERDVETFRFGNYKIDRQHFRINW